MKYMGSCKVFISHASANAQELEPLVDIISGLFYIERAEIAFTALPETGVENFSNFNDALRCALQESRLSVVYLTKTYLQRKYCLFELGAIWGLNKPCFLINRDNIGKDELPDILLAHTYDKLDSLGIDKLCDKLYELSFSPRYKGMTEYNSYKNRVLSRNSSEKDSTRRSLKNPHQSQTVIDYLS